MTISPAIGPLPVPSAVAGPAPQTLENIVNQKQVEQAFILGAVVVKTEQEMFDALLSALDGEPPEEQRSLGLDVTV
ncbi:MAG: hypothetical protein QF473_02970 [Planctomycetota bacterium]|jgi:hypothetical protein|nr:hypothetical protein [Planctomycetota bacterium]